MKVTYDLHIHSALSPCAEPEMTPNNIVNMAAIKELDFIAICDHNGIDNVAPALQVVQRDQLPVIVVPGIEVQTKEDVHLLCLFKDLSALNAFYDHIIAFLQRIPHNAKRFGDQLIFDDSDEVISLYEWSLYASIQLSVDDIVALAFHYGGGVIPAHLDRNSYSMLSNLGFISPELPIHSVEFSPEARVVELLGKHPSLKRYRHVVNSDAHELVQISEAVNFIEVDERSIDALFRALFQR